MRARTTRALLIASCAIACVVQAAEPEVEVAAASGGDELYLGLCVPLNASDILGPEASFRLAGWNANWGQLKIMELAKDGQEVKAGQVIARFEFIAQQALRRVQERIQQAEADRSQARITAEQTVEALQVEQRRLGLEARLAAIDVQKEHAISQKQAALYKIRHRIAEFEADAVRKRLAAAIKSRDAELAFHDQSVARAQQDMGRYKFYEKRFQAVAPHDGVVRHAFNARERRKVQKGDSISPGQKLISVAKDAALGARFFVPEHRIHEIREGMKVVVVSAASGEELPARVTQVDFFPQELGFLMEEPNLPNAREKAFAVVAEFEGMPPAGLTAGVEIRIKAPGQVAAPPGGEAGGR